MEEICPICHLPKSICTCNTRSKQKDKIKIKTDRKKFGKFITIISGLSESQNLKQLAKYLKKKLACGGTIKKNNIIIQGNHRDKVKKLLIKKGFNEDLIDG